MVSPALDRKPDSVTKNIHLIRELRPGAVFPGLWDVAKEIPGDVRRNLRQFLLLRVEATLEDPPGWLLIALRRFRPVLRFGRMTLVTRAADVHHVLSNQETFTVTPYGRTMQRFSGPFALGLNGVRHAEARRQLESVLAPIDVTHLRTWATSTAEQLLTLHGRNGQVDVVTDLAERLPARFVADYFGVPGPDEETLIKWSKTLFEGTFLNVGHQRSLEAEADAVAAEMRSYIDELVSRARHHEATPTPTVLGRLIATQSDNAAVRTMLVGLVLATIPTVAKATTRATDHLLSTAGALPGARAAAQQGDEELLWRYVREALRFRPQTSTLVREAATNTTIAADTGHQRHVNTHELVLAATASAMRDPDMVERPHRFRTDRLESDYLHFGAGPHRCPGQHIAPVLLTAAVAALFRRPGLRRVPGPAGRLVTEGRWPAHLTVAF
jgi:cytochrome P450